MATRMNWDWIEKIQVIVYSTYVSPGFYTIKVMISETNIPCNPLTTPRSKPWKTGKVTNCKSHEQAFKSTSKYVKAWFRENGNPFLTVEA